MESRTNEKPWKDIHSLWIKYVGVSDEMRTLRNRWLFLAQMPRAPAEAEESVFHTNYSLELQKATMPYAPLEAVGNVFPRLVDLNRNVAALFEQLGLSRYVLETETKFAQTTEPLSMGDFRNLIADIRRMLGELQEYLGVLKLTFFQRTSSLEIPYNVGLPRSPQKTMGDEMIHVAADNVARCYLDCLVRNPDLRWDGIVSFVYPERGDFLGANVRWMPSMKLFHMSMSEDGKYFPGAFLILAHEASHVTMYKVVKGRLDHFGWVDVTWTHFRHSCEKVGEEKKGLIGEKCGGCEVRDFLNSLFFPGRNLAYFMQCVADVLGIEIGGICSLQALVDLAPCVETLFRVAFARGFYTSKGETEKWACMEEQSLHESLLQSPERRCAEDDFKRCLEFVTRLATGVGAIFSRDDRDFFDFPRVDNGNENEPSCMISNLVKKRFTYPFSQSLADGLADGTCIPLDVDIRRILDVFYRLYRQGKLPSYAATLHSLASARFTSSHRA